MKKYLIALLFLLLVFVGCSNDPANVNKIKETNNEAENEGENEFIPLSEEEAKELVTETLTAMTDVLLGEVAEHPEFYNVNINVESVEQAKRDIDQVEGDMKTQFGKVREVFAEYIHSDHLDDMYYEFIYFAYVTHHLEFLNKNNLEVRLQIEEQDESQFTYSFITIEDEVGFNIPGTYELSFEKEGDDWKFSSYTFTNVSDQPLNLTKEDIEAMGDNPGFDEYELEARVIDQVEKDGKEYIVYENVASEGGYKVAIDVETSEQDLELALTYDE